MHRKWFRLAALLVALAFALGACGGDDDDDGEAAGDTTAAECEQTDSVTLQLKWVTQAQFAGYYAAEEQGYYDDECLDVTIKPGARTSSPSRSCSAARPSSG